MIRYNKIPKPQFQFRLISAFLATGVTGVVLHHLLCVSALADLLEAEEVSAFAAQQFHTEMWQQLTLTLAFAVPLLLLVGILVTFRIAGPLHSIEQYLARLARGETAEVCRVRKRDELQELCQLVNEVRERFRAEGRVAEFEAAMEADPEPIGTVEA